MVNKYLELVLLIVYTVDKVERMRNPKCIDCGYPGAYRIRTTRPTTLHKHNECDKKQPKYLKLNNAV